MFSSNLNNVSITHRVTGSVPTRRILCFNSSTGTPCNVGAPRRIETLDFSVIRQFIHRNIGTIIVTYGATASTTIGSLHRRCSVPVVNVRPTLGITYSHNSIPSSPRRVPREIVITTAPLALHRQGFTALVSQFSSRGAVFGRPYPSLIRVIRSKQLNSRSLIVHALRNCFSRCSVRRVSSIILNYARFIFCHSCFHRLLPRQTTIVSNGRNAIHRLNIILRSLNGLTPRNTANNIRLTGSSPSRHIAQLSHSLLGT